MLYSWLEQISRDDFGKKLGESIETERSMLNTIKRDSDPGFNPKMNPEELKARVETHMLEADGKPDILKYQGRFSLVRGPLDRLIYTLEADSKRNSGMMMPQGVQDGFDYKIAKSDKLFEGAPLDYVYVLDRKEISPDWLYPWNLGRFRFRELLPEQAQLQTILNKAIDVESITSSSRSESAVNLRQVREKFKAQLRLELESEQGLSAGPELESQGISYLERAYFYHMGVESDAKPKRFGIVDPIAKAIDEDREQQPRPYSILSTLSSEDKRSAVEFGERSPVRNKVMGAMTGMAVGDSLGYIFEFTPAQDGPKDDGVSFDLTMLEREGYPNGVTKAFKFGSTGTAHHLKRLKAWFTLKPGQWTDDSAQGLCMADSLLFRRGFDGSDMRVRFWQWWNRGYNNAMRLDPSLFRRWRPSVGLGRNTEGSIAAVATHFSTGRGKVPAEYTSDTQRSGNGSLMRLVPMVIFYFQWDFRKAAEFVMKSSYTTHTGHEAAYVCVFQFWLIRDILNDASSVEIKSLGVKSFLEQSADRFLQSEWLETKINALTSLRTPASAASRVELEAIERVKRLATGKLQDMPRSKIENCWAWRENGPTSPKVKETLNARRSAGTYNGNDILDECYFGSYSMDAMPLALWCVVNSGSFGAAMEKALNLAGDSDTVGAIVGQLAGALYGHSEIPAVMKQYLNDHDDNDFAVTALLLRHLSSSLLPSRVLTLPSPGWSFACKFVKDFPLPGDFFL